MNSTESLSFYSTTFQIIACLYTSSVVLLGIVLTFFGDFYVLFNIIDAFIMIYFLLFTTANYPVNVVDFSKLFGNFHYEFFPNPFKSLLGITTKVASLSPFNLNGYSDIFLDNISLQLNLIIIVLVIYLIIKVLTKTASSLDQLLSPHLNRAWEWDTFIYLVWIFSFQFSIFSYLQITQFSFSTLIEAASTSSSIAILGISFGGPFLAFYIINEHRFNLYKPAKLRTSQFRFLSLVRGLKINKEQLTELEKIENEKKKEEEALQQKQQKTNENSQQKKDEVSIAIQEEENPILNAPFVFIKNELQVDVYDVYSPHEQSQFQSSAKFANALVLGRRTIFALVMILWNGSTKIQMGVICTMNAILIIYYLTVKPYIFQIDNLRNFINELFFFLIQVTIIFYDNKTSTSQSNTDSNQVFLGWGFIIGAMIILMLSYFDLIFKLVKSIQRYNKYKKIEEQNKQVAPVEEIKAIEQKKDVPVEESINQQANPENPNDKTAIIPENAKSAEEKQIKSVPENKVENIQVEENQNKQTTEVEKKDISMKAQKVENPPTQQLNSSMTALSLKNIQPVPLATNQNHEQSYQPHQFGTQEISEAKQRLKKIYFKRNPFLSKEDDALIKIERQNNDSKTTFGAQNSHRSIEKQF